MRPTILVTGARGQLGAELAVSLAPLGRVIATVRMCALGAAPVAYLLAGPLSDRLAEPATWAEASAALRPGSAV